MSEDCSLGKLEYWESCYIQETENFTEFGDEGEIWYKFGEEVLEKLLPWTDALIRGKFTNPSDIQILDVGCGNGHLLFELHNLGYTNLLGTDYSQQSVILAEKIAQSKGILSIKFMTDDILHSNLNQQFDLIVDKGTFDAISLGTGTKEEYPKGIAKLLKPNGILVLTSCNFTRDELKKEFEGYLQYMDHIKGYKSFTFGGEEGNQVSTVAFCSCSSPNS